MRFELEFFNPALLQKQAVSEIVKHNELTAKFGLALTAAQAVELVETRARALSANGRVEFGGGVIGNLIYEFCDSPYISMDNYEHTLHKLTEMFYYYKNETLDLISDDDLIKFMKKAFDGVCHGSLDLLSGRELDGLARSLRYGYDPDYSEEECEDGEY